MDGLLDRIERVSGAGENSVFSQCAKTLGQCCCGTVGNVPDLGAGPQLGYGHLIHRQGAGLIAAQNGGRTQRLDRGGPARQHARLGNAPRPHHHEHCQHEGKFLGQHRHAERDSAEQAFEPRAAQQAVKQDRDGAHRQSDERDDLHEPLRLAAQQRRLRLDRTERLPDLSDLAARTGGVNFGKTMAANHQGSRKDERQIVAARARSPRRRSCRDLSHRHRFSGQERLVRLHVLTGKQQRVGRNAIALGDENRVAAHDLPTRDAPLDVLPDDESARARQIAQGFKDMLAPGLLHNHNHDGDRREGKQYHGITQTAEQEIDEARAQEEREHRLAENIKSNERKRPMAGPGQLVGTFVLKSSNRRRLRKPRHRS